MRIVLSNSYGTPNIGDDAILTAMISELNANGHDVGVLSFYPELTRRRHPQAKAIRSGVFKGLIGTVTAVAKADLLIVGGGGILQDSTSLGNLLFHLSRVGIARLFGTAYAFIGVGVGPLRSRLGRYLMAIVCRGASYISVRDSDSVKLLDELGFDTGSVSVDADLAHLLHCETVVRAEVHKPLKIGLSVRPPVGKRHVRSSMSHELRSQLRPYVDVINQLVAEKDAEFVFVSMNAEQDDAIGYYLRQQVMRPESFQVLSGVSAPINVIEALRGLDLVLGMRLHSLILAAGQGVPIIAVSYDNKVSSFMASIGMASQSLELPQVTAASLRSLVDSSLADHHRLTASLATAIPKQAELARRAMKLTQIPL